MARKAARSSKSKAATKKPGTGKTAKKARPTSKSAKPAKKTVSKKTQAQKAKPSRDSTRKSPPKSAGKAAPKPKAALVEGALAPDFQLPRDGGDLVSLSSLAGRKIVIFFYPRADTPGCTREAIDFTRLTPQFEAVDTVLLGVSADPVKAQNAFRDKHSLCTPLLSDEAHDMLNAYGVWGEKSMYGKTFDGILRTTVLVGRDGRIAKVWRSVSVDGHADAVLAAARAL